MPSEPTKITLPLDFRPTAFDPALKDAEAELFDVSGSAVADETVTVLLTTAPLATVELTVATMTAFSVAPTLSDGKVTPRLLPVPPHVPCGESQEENVISGGRLSASVIGPVVMPFLFVTVSR